MTQVSTVQPAQLTDPKASIDQWRRDPAIPKSSPTLRSIIRQSPAAEPVRARRLTQIASADKAQQIGVSVVSLQRLIEAVRNFDHNLVTPAQLIQTYRIALRSARRLLSQLNRAGYADESIGLGRPHAAYRVDVDRLRATE